MSIKGERLQKGGAVKVCNAKHCFTKTKIKKKSLIRKNKTRATFFKFWKDNTTLNLLTLSGRRAAGSNTGGCHVERAKNHPVWKKIEWTFGKC